ncbi:MAG: ATP-binding protein [Chitinophagaceae bacterium]
MHEPFSEQELILIASTAIILVLIILVVAALLIQHKRKFRHRQQLTEIKSHYEKTLLETELKIQGETLKAISRNLHDNIGSNISTAMLLLYKDETIDQAEFEPNRKEALIMLGKIVDDLKNIARSLNPAYLTEIGLSEAIRQRVQQLEKTKKYEIEFYLNEAPQALNTEKQLILFYIFQEAVNNIATHARATSMTIHLHYDVNRLTLNIKDNGKGITNTLNKKTNNNPGSGLMNMKHHAEMINAELIIESTADVGTGIMLTLPAPYSQNGTNL